MQRRVAFNERGFALAYVVIGLLAFCAMTAVAVDTARIAFSASEVQTVADIAATAAAVKLMNGGNAGQAQADADTVVSRNKVSGQAAASAPIVVGNVNTAGTFTANGNPINAAKATATATVTNLFARVMSSNTTAVTKTATATVATISSSQGQLPIVLSQSCFDSNHDCTADPNACPSATTINNSACWTGYTGHGASLVSSMMPTTAGCSGAGGATPPTLNVGDNVDVTNGMTASAYKDLFCVWCANPNQEYVITVVNNGTCGAGACNGNKPVVGFATIKISRFLRGGVTKTCASGSSPPPDGFEVQSFRNMDVPGGVGGCGTCGTGFIRLIG